MTVRTDGATENLVVGLLSQDPMPSAYAIAEQAGVSPTTVYRIARRNGIPISRDLAKRRRRRTSPEQDAEIVRRYAAGESAQALAEEFGFAMHLSVVKRVREAGGTVRGHGSPLRHLSDEQGAEVRRLRDLGMSQEEIGKRIGVGQGRISRYLIENGLRTRILTPRSPTGIVRRSNGYLARRVDTDDPLFVMAGANHYIAEHRYVMAQALGRPLKRSETVHHINGDVADNGLENLQLRQGNHGKGVRFTCANCGSHDVRAMPL